MAKITDLPDELLADIFSLLQPKDFLHLCLASKTLGAFRLDPTYWRTLTSTTFRLPVTPLLRANGPRWYSLYRRLKTQTKLYSWGGNARGVRRPRMGLARRGHRPTAPTDAGGDNNFKWPSEVAVPGEVEVISDLQCGGWSTSILSSTGHIYVLGLVDGDTLHRYNHPTNEFTRLHYLTESTSTIAQFSSGRKHILALTDESHIISWDSTVDPGLKIRSRTGIDFGGKPTKVVAGWELSSAYVAETGIIYWKPVKNNEPDDMLDAVQVEERIIPGTARRMTGHSGVIEVISYIVLDRFIAWLTSDSRVMACAVHAPTVNQVEPSLIPFEVPGYSSGVRKAVDIQGQFTKFAIFTDRGEVLAGDVDYLIRCRIIAQQNIDTNSGLPSSPSTWSGLQALVESRPPDKPALQHNQVIELAFGDHHYHALHANGKITSFGTDARSCGSLGLGDIRWGSRFRGVVFPRMDNVWGDSKLLPKAEHRGREVWFEPEKKDWLEFLELSVRSGRLVPENLELLPPHLRPYGEIWAHEETRVMFSEWIEQEGRHWAEGPANQLATAVPVQARGKKDDFHLDAYFTIRAVASGWHSAALVLVDPEKEHEAAEKWTVTMPVDTSAEDDGHLARSRATPGHFEDTTVEQPVKDYIWMIEGFPKIELPNGVVMPGETAIKSWRDGMPSLAELDMQ